MTAPVNEPVNMSSQPLNLTSSIPPQSSFAQPTNFALVKPTFIPPRLDHYKKNMSNRSVAPSKAALGCVANTCAIKNLCNKFSIKL